MELYRPQRRAYNVPIVPLIDILAILLIFVIVTSTRKKPRPAVPIDLPTVREVATTTLNQERVILAATTDGKLYLDNLEVPEGQLARFLQAFKNVNPDKKLELEADEAVPLGRLFEIWEALTEVGIELKEVPARIKVQQSDDS